jgi:hypothetical protein
MGLLTSELAETIAARWRRALKGLREEDDGPERTHWRTKVTYAFHRLSTDAQGGAAPEAAWLYVPATP